jgi:Lrp/AsnC family transcriptional regulator, regulator for asnA, asnC and gidA
MPQDYQYDKTDLAILTLLQQNAAMPYTEIAKQVHVSPGTVHVRMKKMEDLGIVRGSELRIDYSKIGFDVTAFLGVYLQKSSYYDQALKDLKNIPEVVNVHYTTGTYSMFVKIICRDTNHLREVLHDKLQKVNGIERTETIISLEESIDRNISLENIR